MCVDSNYQNLVKKILDEGYFYDDPNREGVQRLEIPSYTFRHDFKDGFPAITLKKLAFKSVTTELIWFLRGDTNIKYLVDNGCNIWNKDAYGYYLKAYTKGVEKPYTFKEFIQIIKNFNIPQDHPAGSKGLGSLDKVYGHYWRNFNGVDQIKQLIDDMINKPMSSELLVVARDPSHKEEQALPCCHYGFQIVMRPLNKKERQEELEKYYPTSEGIASIEDEWVDFVPKYGFELHWKQRSVDTFLGLPFNIASYAELALTLQALTGHKALAIQGDLKKVHLYDNSIEKAKELVTRECSIEHVKLLVKDEFYYLTDESIAGKVSIDDLFNAMKPDWFKLEGYNPQPPMRVEMLSRT